MTLLELLLIGIGLSMDAFAVAICKGLAMEKIRYKDTFVIALFFGGFQAIMPLAGWVLGSRFATYINSFDHWIAFVLLLIIGGKMVKEGFGGDAESCPVGVARLDYKELLLMAVATSIDALAVGITFAFLEVSIVPAITIIGLTTFILSAVGVFVGNFFGARYKSRAEIVGGVILIGIGAKILLEHLGILG